MYIQTRRNHLIVILNYGNNLNPHMEMHIVIPHCLFQLEISNNET